MDSSPLSRLPPELRNYIYDLCLTQPTAIYIIRGNRPVVKATFAGPILLDPDLFVMKAHLRSEDSTNPSRGKSTFPWTPLSPNTFALARTCKAIHTECGKMIYSCNTFRIHLYRFQPQGTGADMMDRRAHELTFAGHEAAAFTFKEAEQILTGWRLFKQKIGQQNADALQLVQLDSSLHWAEWAGSGTPALPSLILAALSKEVLANKGQLKLSARIFVGSCGGFDTQIVVVDLARTAASLQQLAVVVDEDPLKRNVRSFRVLPAMLRKWAEEVRTLMGGEDGTGILDGVATQGTGVEGAAE